MSHKFNYMLCTICVIKITSGTDIQEMNSQATPTNPISPMLSACCCFQYRCGHGLRPEGYARVLKGADCEH